jgi:peptide chain release factor 1
MNKLRTLSKEQSDLQDTVNAYREYKQVKEQHAEARAMLDDKLDGEMREMVKEEMHDLAAQIE